MSCHRNLDTLVSGPQRGSLQILSAVGIVSLISGVRSLQGKEKQAKEEG